MKSADGKGEFVYRVRGREIKLGSPKEWMVVTPHGIDPFAKLDSRILYPGSSVTLQFLQDEDKDRLPALSESTYGCSDSPFDANGDGRVDGRDTDGDALDDRFETLVGWEVETPFHSGRAHSSCRSKDTDGDSLSDRDEAPALLKYDSKVPGLVLFDDGVDDDNPATTVNEDEYIAANAPKRDMTAANEDPTLTGNRWAIWDPVTDPSSRDTDLDGLEDTFELTPYRNSATMELVRTSPEHPDSDNDQLGESVERKLGSNPRLDDKAAYWDSDRDGLTDAQEVADDNGDFVIGGQEKVDAAGNPKGWEVAIAGMHPRTVLFKDICWDGTCAAQPVSAPRRVYSSKYDADTDDDGLTDYEEYKLKTDPENADTDDDGTPDGRDTDGDGLTDLQEVKGFMLRDGTVVRTSPTKVDTDNDKRSDGEEADLPGNDIIIVGVTGKNPYQSFSHPLRPDTDLDSLVDGDEQTGAALVDGDTRLGSTDPAKSDTDGDGASDYSEVKSEYRRPLVPDLNVDVYFQGISVTKDGDDGDDDLAEIRYSFKLLKGDADATVCVDRQQPRRRQPGRRPDRGRAGPRQPAVGCRFGVDDRRAGGGGLDQRQHLGDRRRPQDRLHDPVARLRHFGGGRARAADGIKHHAGAAALEPPPDGQVHVRGGVRGHPVHHHPGVVIYG